jgi:tRNA/rRNA methyltransferase
MNKHNPLDNVRIVLSHTSHPGNIGAAARAMKTMGLGTLYLVNPKSFPDPAAIARATGALDVLERAQVCSTLDEALHGTVLAVACTARSRDLSHEILTAREAAPVLLQHALQGPVALLFGTEMSGLTNEETGKCQLLAHIPTNPDYSSLNLGAAVQVMAYELRTALPQAAATDAKARPLASFEDVEFFYQRLEQILVETEFLDPAQPKRLMARLRRMFARARLEAQELNILQGMLTALRK